MDHKKSLLIAGIILAIIFMAQVVPTLISSSDWLEFITGSALAVLFSGYLIGALVSGAGGAGMAAAAGAPIGAIAGLWYAEYEADINYKRAYSNCLFQRGHYPIN